MLDELVDVLDVLDELDVLVVVVVVDVAGAVVVVTVVTVVVDAGGLVVVVWPSAATTAHRALMQSHAVAVIPHRKATGAGSARERDCRHLGHGRSGGRHGLRLDEHLEEGDRRALLPAT